MVGVGARLLGQQARLSKIGELCLILRTIDLGLGL